MLWVKRLGSQRAVGGGPQQVAAPAEQLDTLFQTGDFRGRRQTRRRGAEARRWVVPTDRSKLPIPNGSRRPPRPKQCRPSGKRSRQGRDQGEEAPRRQVSTGDERGYRAVGTLHGRRANPG